MLVFIRKNTSKWRDQTRQSVTSLTSELQMYITYKNVHGVVRRGSKQRGRHHKRYRLRFLHSHVLLWGCHYGAFHLWTLCSVSTCFFLSFLAAFCGRDGTGTSYRGQWYTADQVYYFILKETEIITSKLKEIIYFAREINYYLPEINHYPELMII